MLRALGSLLIAVFLATEVKAEGYPLDYWARRAAVGNIGPSWGGVVAADDGARARFSSGDR